MSLKHQYVTTVWVEGIGDLGKFDSFQGGGGDSEEKKYREGGELEEITLGGFKSRENAKVARLFKRERDAPIFKRLDALRGKARMVITRQPTDEDMNAVGEPHVYNGKVKAVKGPDSESTSNDEALLEIEQSTAGPVG